MMTHRRSRDCRKCTFHIQEDSSKWATCNCAHGLLIILSVGVYGRSRGLRQGVQLVRQYDVRCGSPDLVWHLLHVHPLLYWHEGSRNRPYEPAICLSFPALCGMVCCHQLPYYLLGGCSEINRRSRSEEHTSELQSPDHLLSPLLLEKKKP